MSCILWKYFDSVLHQPIPIVKHLVPIAMWVFLYLIFVTVFTAFSWCLFSAGTRVQSNRFSSSKFTLEYPFSVFDHFLSISDCSAISEESTKLVIDLADELSFQIFWQILWKLKTILLHTTALFCLTLWPFLVFLILHWVLELPVFSWRFMNLLIAQVIFLDTFSVWYTWIFMSFRSPVYTTVVLYSTFIFKVTSKSSGLNFILCLRTVWFFGDAWNKCLIFDMYVLQHK